MRMTRVIAAGFIAVALMAGILPAAKKEPTYRCNEGTDCNSHYSYIICPEVAGLKFCQKCEFSPTMAYCDGVSGPCTFDTDMTSCGRESWGDCVGTVCINWAPLPNSECGRYFTCE